LEAKKLGPFKILAIINPVVFRLKLPATMKIHNVFHVSLLSPKPPTLFHVVTPPPLPVIIDDDQEWEVAAILDSKSCVHGVVYLVDWVGYGPKECLWPLITNLCNTMDHLHAFHKAFPNKPGSPSYSH
jgi:hypothetical protein